MKEIWKSVEGYEGLYEISNQGNIRSLNWHRTGMTSVLKPSLNSKGYLLVKLYKNGKEKSFKVHRLVALEFLPNPQNLDQVNHKNEIKTDNRLENLEWCSCVYNNNYGTRNERAGKANRGKHHSEETKRKISEANINNPNKSKPVLQYSKNGLLVKEFPSIIEAWRETGISYGHICECCIGKRKSSGGFIWKYKEVSENELRDLLLLFHVEHQVAGISLTIPS